MEKPLAGVYKWVGFVVFWGALVWGFIELARWVVWANAFVDAALAL